MPGPRGEIHRLDVMHGVLIADDDPAPNDVFLGTCFVGVDLHIGDGHRGGPHHLTTGLDGTYVLGRSGPDGYRLGTDHDGHARLFEYRSADRFAVGDSWLAVARWAHANHLPLTVRPEHVEAWTGSGAFMEQLWSYHTVFEEIALLPAGVDVEIVRTRAGGPSLHHRPRRPGVGDLPSDYAEALTAYVRIWSARFQTLLMSDADVTIDLTGGLDSRTLFAFAAATIRRDPALADRLRVFTQTRNPGLATDAQIAARILERAGLTAVDRRETTPGWRGSLTDRFDRWAHERLGQYSLLSELPNAAPDPWQIQISGVGGERFRPSTIKFSPDFDEHVAKRRKFFSSDARFQAFAAAAHDGLHPRHHSPRISDDRLVEHHRAFRSRLHSGAQTTGEVRLIPLGGAMLDQVARVGGHDRFRDAQVFYDIMASLDPSLLDHPFDQDSKRPGASRRAALTVVDVGDVTPGQVVRSIRDPAERHLHDDSDDPGIGFLERRFHERLGTVPPALRPDRERTSAAFRRAHERGQFQPQTDFGAVHFVELWSQIDELASGA